MATYINKDVLDMFRKKVVNRDFLKEHTYDVELVEEDREVETQAGKVLITAGNYIMTSSTGKKVGITPQDLENQYERR